MPAPGGHASLVYNREKHHRRSIRLKGYDYSQAGAYFVTICARNHECIFGEINDGEMKLNEYGKIVRDEWMRTEDVRPNVELDEFIIMPNHVHGILVINTPVGARRCLAPERREQPSKNVNGYGNIVIHRANQGATHRVAPTCTSGSIGAIVGQFKSLITKQINQIRNTPGLPVWHRNYHEHIIRNERELHEIRKYIRNNPLHWDRDIDNPMNV